MGDGRRARAGGKNAVVLGVGRRRDAGARLDHPRRSGSASAPRFWRYGRDGPEAHREVVIEVAEKFTRDLAGRSVGDMPPRTAAVEAAPIVKWVGGKSKLLSELVTRLPPRFRRYYEPFAG